LRDVLEVFDPPVAERLAEQFTPLVLCVADGAFVARHIDPDTDLREIFHVLRRALTALAREIAESAAREAGS
jgi:anti-sigma-K factor RskA